jgi:tetratricopeptide (TPR) repeat protein
MEAAAAPDAQAAQVIAWARAAVSLVFAGAGALAERLFARIEAAPLDAGDRVLVGRVQQARATRAMAAGDVAGYLDHTMASAQAFDAAGDVRTACVQQNNAGYALAMLGALGEAESTLRKALVAADRMGMTSIAGVARQNLGLVLAHSGALQEARAVEERGIETAHASGDALMTACGHAYLAEILTIGRNYEAAERAARMAVTLVGDRDHEVRAIAQAALARVLLATHRAPEGLAASEKAFALLPVVGSVGAEAPVRLVHAEALRAAGREEAAREVLRVARDRLVERAAKIASASMRSTFLAQVPANARTMTLATEWRID